MRPVVTLPLPPTSNPVLDEFLANMAVVWLHYLTPEQVPEMIAQMALTADARLVALLPPLPEWLP